MSEFKVCKCENYRDINSKYGEFIIHRADYNEFQITDWQANKDDVVLFNCCPHCGGVLDVDKYKEIFTEPEPRVLAELKKWLRLKINTPDNRIAVRGGANYFTESDRIKRFEVKAGAYQDVLDYLDKQTKGE